MNLKTVLMASAIMALAAFGTGCGNACDDLADKFEDCGGTDVGDGDTEAECTDEAEKLAECLVDCLNDDCSNLIDCNADCA